MNPQFAMLPPMLPAPIQNACSSRNKNRNRKPCGNCSGSQVRCNVSPPYSASLCKNCEEEGLTECPPYIPRNNGRRRPVRRAPYKMRKDTMVHSPTENQNPPEIPNMLHATNATKMSQGGNDTTPKSFPLTEENVRGSFQTTRTEAVEEVSASTASFEQVFAGEDISGNAGWMSGDTMARTATSNSLGIWYPHVPGEPGGQIRQVFPASFQPRFSYQNFDRVPFLDGVGAGYVQWGNCSGS